MIRLSSFAGEIPRIHPRLLPDNNAQAAWNVKLENGALVPIRRGRLEHHFSSVMRTVYKADNEWLGWPGFVHVVPAPIAENRLYITGDGTPKIRVDGVTMDLAVQHPSAALTVTLLSGTVDPDLSSEVTYVYTWVTNLGEESEPCPLSTPIETSPGVFLLVTGFVAPPSGRGISLMRIYRSQTNALGENELYLIHERAVSTGQFIDDIAVYPIQEPIPSLDWTPPPDGLRGIVTMPNGMMAAFVGKKIYFCEPYKPHAWPEKYVLTVDFNVIGLGVFGSALAIMTDGYPYIASGKHPETMVMERLEVNLPCIAARSIVDMGYTVAYASNDGLVTVSQQGAVLRTKDTFTVEQWRRMNPASFTAGYYAGRYMASYAYADAQGVEQRGIMIVDLSGEQPFIIRASDDADAMFNEIGTGTLYLLRNGVDVFEWDAINQPYGELLWRSKRFVGTSYMNFGAIIAEGEEADISESQQSLIEENAAIREANRALIDSGETGGAIGALPLGMVPIGGSLLTPIEEDEGGGDTEYSFVVLVYADGELVDSIYDMNEIVRIVSGFRAKTWEIEVRSTQQITAIAMGFSPEEIKGS